MYKRQGPASFTRWRGTLNAAVTPDAGYGSIEDLRTTYAKLASLSFTDHYGVTFGVILDRSVNENSLTPVWDAASNKFQVELVVMKI